LHRKTLGLNRSNGSSRSNRRKISRFARNDKEVFKPRQLSSRPSLRFGPDLRRRRNQGPAGLNLDNRPFRRTVHQTHRTFRISTAIVNFQQMLRRRRDHHRIDVDFATDDVAHAAFGALVVGDFQAGHKLVVQMVQAVRIQSISPDTATSPALSCSKPSAKRAVSSIKNK